MIENLKNNDPLDVVFLDETWIFARRGLKRSWQDDSSKSKRRRTTTEGKRFIVLHAGSIHDFAEDASLIFSTKNKSADYHDNMNSENFEKWLTKRLLSGLQNPNIIVLDNAKYHFRVEEKQPTRSWTKEEMQTWLKKRI